MNEIIEIILEIPKSPIIHITLLMGLTETIFVYGFVNQLAKALATVGINLNKEGKKKWRKVINHFVVIVFITFVFFLYFARLSEYRLPH